MIRCTLSLFGALVLVLASLSSARANPALPYAGSDLAIGYCFDDVTAIDWPTLIYLNNVHGARIELIGIREGALFRIDETRLDEREMRLRWITLDARTPSDLSDLRRELHDPRPLDIVLLGTFREPSLRDRVLGLLRDDLDTSGVFFGLRRIFEVADSLVGNQPIVTLNRPELAGRWADRMALDIPRLVNWLEPTPADWERLARYVLLASTNTSIGPLTDFIGDLGRCRLLDHIETAVPSGEIAESLLRRARNYLTFVSLAESTRGVTRVEAVLNAQAVMSELVEAAAVQPALRANPAAGAYFAELQRRIDRAAIVELGLSIADQVIVREASDGPVVKYRTNMSVNGSQPVTVSALEFMPSPDSAAVPMLREPIVIAPHQAFIREYRVDFPSEQLTTQAPESLLFVTRLEYAGRTTELILSKPLYEEPELSITFVPSFRFLPRPPEVEVDRTVASYAWTVVIEKPRYWSGQARLNLVTPRGVFAGAYRQEVDLVADRSFEVVRIPYSISNLFELGVQRPVVSLLVDNRPVAVDTALMRIAEFAVDDRRDIGLLPDSTGKLEDILRMSGMPFRPLTERSLMVGDLTAYDAIVVGSGAARSYPSLPDLAGQLADYVRSGGSLVLLGQPSDWPRDVLPFRFEPLFELVARDQIENRIPKARILSDPYPISDRGLLASLVRQDRVAAAIVAPSEVVYATPRGGTLLSVSRLGDGQLIYCGLPLVELISELNIEAIHLLANILNY